MKQTVYSLWFITGSQNLYGPETLARVDHDSRIIADFFDADPGIPTGVIFKPVVKSPEEIQAICEAANNDAACAGVITWMHTFSPSKMWIAGLMILNKPLLHLNTQFNREIPWDTIDMDFMNLNQSAHGDREHGFILTRLRKNRKVIAGYWQDESTLRRIGAWARAAIGFAEGKRLKIARFGDNMREVAVTESDKVEAQMRLGWSVNGYSLGELADHLQAVTSADVDEKMAAYTQVYELATDQLKAVRYQARIEAALERFLVSGGFGGFTTTFENLVGLEQLPGLAVQNLMAGGYGFGAEGDWKMAGLLNIMKKMSAGLPGGTSFMEDYTYHLEKGNEKVLGAHMLEVCPSIAEGKARIEVHPLGIGGKADPARLVFDGKTGPAILVTLVDMGNRFRMIVNDVNAMKPDRPMPKLPVAGVMWQPLPDLMQASEAWILAGGAHHSIMSYDLTIEHMRALAQMLDIELVHINAKTDVDELTDKLALNDLVWRLKA
jgi:L-arabinose isomerase